MLLALGKDAERGQTIESWTIRENSVGPTFTLLAAGLLAAQTAEPSVTNSAKPPCNCQKNQQTSGYVQPVAATAPATGFSLFRGKNETVVAEERPSLWSKFTSVFKKSEPTEPPTYTTEPPVEAPKGGPFRLMQRLPAGQPTNEPAPTPVPAAPVKVSPITYQGVPVNQPTNPVTPVSGTVQAGNVIKSTELPPSRPNRISPDVAGKVGHETDYSWITGQLRIENGLYVIHYATPETVDRHNGSLVLQSERDLRGFQDGDFVSVRGSIVGANGRSMYRLTNIDRLPR